MKHNEPKNHVITSSHWQIAVLLLVAFGLWAQACSTSASLDESSTTSVAELRPIHELSPPSPDPRVGLAGGLFDAEEAIWNLRLLSTTPPPPDFLAAWGTDLAFKDNFAIQGNYNGFIIWDITDPANPQIEVDFLCPASQSDVSVYGDLLFVSGEGLGGRLDCGTDGVREAVSEERLRGIRIFDISNIREPEYIANVQTCRGSHTHSIHEALDDPDHIYVYVSGSAPVRPEDELPGCVGALPDEDEDSALFRIEIIQVPLANPAASRIVSAPRIFEGLDEPPPVHGLAPEEMAAVERARAAGAFIYEGGANPWVLNNRMVAGLLNRVVEERGGEGDPTAADSLFLRENLDSFVESMRQGPNLRREFGPNQCHDITIFPEVGLAGGACEGYGLLLDVRDPINPVRIDAVADSNFAYWHSATFNNSGTTVIFTDEWGGGTQPKCRATDPYEWGANAIYSITEDGKMVFESYFKMPAEQTNMENCVAHNGSILPIPGRDIMVQGWYQGGINVFDFTDPANPVEIAFHDRGPISEERYVAGGVWSIYWYNGYLVSSLMARGLDIFELIPSEYLTANEIAAANTVVMQQFNPQAQPKWEWPATFVLAKAYLDQIERDRGMPKDEVDAIRAELARAETLRGDAQSQALQNLVSHLAPHEATSSQSHRIRLLRNTLSELSGLGDIAGL